MLLKVKHFEVTLCIKGYLLFKWICLALVYSIYWKVFRERNDGDHSC